MSRELTELEAEIMQHVTDDWRSLKDIVWAFNGPREATVQMGNIQQVLARLCRRRIIESQTGRSFQRADNTWGAPGASRLYRKRAA